MAAIGVHHTDTVDIPWDGPANERRLRNTGDGPYYRGAYAWVDPDKNADTKAAYKFIHHEVHDDGAIAAANVNGARAGIAVLNGGRGGANIPDADRQGVYDHLAAHLRDAGEDPPPLDLAAGAARSGGPPAAIALPAGWEERRRQLRPRHNASWYRIQAAAAADEAEIYLYDEIGFWGVTAADFVRDLQAVTASKIVLHLNTPGGDAFDGIAIYNALREHPAQIETRVDALAASAGSVIAMAGDPVIMARNATLMIHKAWGLTIGNSDDMQKAAEVLAKVDGAIAGVYADKAGGAVAHWLAAMAAETWYTAREAVDAGLADLVAGDPPAEPAQNRFDLSMFANVPARLRQGAAAQGPAHRDRSAGDELAAGEGVVGEPSDASSDPEYELLEAALRIAEAS